MPTMTSITPVTGTVNVGNIASVNYVADGTGSDLTQVYLSFRNEAAGKQFSVEDRDGDGNATGKLNQNMNLVSGTYEFQNGWVVDQANNQLNLSAQDFDASIVLTGGKIPITDSAMPTLSSMTVVTDTLNVGELASVNYVGDGTGSDLRDVVFTFRNEAPGTPVSYTHLTLPTNREV